MIFSEIQFIFKYLKTEAYHSTIVEGNRHKTHKPSFTDSFRQVDFLLIPTTETIQGTKRLTEMFI